MNASSPDATTASKPRRTFRRFPLTLTAVIGGALAVPLYLASVQTPEGSSVQTPEGSSVQTPEGSSVQTPEGSSVQTPEGSPVLADAAAEPSIVAQVEAVEVDVPTAIAPSFEAKGEDFAMAAPMGAAEAESVAAADMPAMPRRTAKTKSRRRPASPPPPPPPGRSGWSPSGGEGSGDAFIARDSSVKDGRRGGFDQQLQANILTAGRTSDLQSRTSIDELRTKAIAHDSALGQAISNNDHVGPLPGSGAKPQALDIGFVLDTTGSMGDEMAYLKVEMRSIAQAIATEFPGVQQRYALVAYKDHGDEYVVRHHDFEPLDRFVEHLGQEYAGGGGDFPEALGTAMASATQLQWSRGDAARMVFVVGDAPPHTREYDTYVDATAALADGDVSVYPVASSGVETVCEYLMRWAARATGGEYIFLTDHSGIGNPHADPHVDQFEVKTLRDHMLEVIRNELQGNEVVPPPSEQVALRCGNEEPEPSWWDKHGLLVLILGGVFVAGFAGDMAIHHARRKRS